MARADAPRSHGVVDLHTHTVCSDGTLAPAALVKLAHEVGLEALGITDHDSVGGIAEAAEAARVQGMTLIPGVELSSSFEDHELHLLGYFVDVTDDRFLRQLEELAARRETRAHRIVERLNATGIEVAFERVRAIAGTGSIGRPHVARALMELGIVGTVAEAFDRYLSKGRPGYVPRAQFEPEDAARLVLDAGGVPVLAHPLTTGDPEGVARRLLPVGLRGFEVYYSEYDRRTQGDLLAIAERWDLIPTGGSDFHGPNFRPGRDLGKPDVPAETVALLREAAGLSRGG